LWEFPCTSRGISWQIVDYFGENITVTGTGSLFDGDDSDG
jgi:hypothetical protein